jgi:hypothetical protein
MYVENSSTPIYVEASKMVNQNYVDNGDPASLEAGQTPADNLLLSVEGAGSATVFFKDENDETQWDLTGKTQDTTELEGDFFIGAYSEAAGSPDKGTGPNSASLNFENSSGRARSSMGTRTRSPVSATCPLTRTLPGRSPQIPRWQTWRSTMWRTSPPMSL